MEQAPQEDSIIRVARLVSKFVSEHSCFDFSEEGEVPTIVIFKNADLDTLPFDENGEIDAEEVMELMPKAIFPNFN